MSTIKQDKKDDSDNLTEPHSAITTQVKLEQQHVVI